MIQAAFENNDFDPNDIPGTLRLIIFRLSILEKGQGTLNERLEPLFEERKLAIAIKERNAQLKNEAEKIKQQNKLKWRDRWQNLVAAFVIISGVFGLIKEIDGIYLEHHTVIQVPVVQMEKP